MQWLGSLILTHLTSVVTFGVHSFEYIFDFSVTLIFRNGEKNERKLQM